MDFSLLGSITYARTYSRFVDGRWEAWEDTVERFIRETSKNLPVSDKEKQEIREHMNALELFPAGRTLWMGGTEFINRYPAAAFNCFSGDTEFLTEDGIRTFHSFNSGDSVKVLNGRAAWSEATVRQYGVQKLLKLTLRRKGSKAIKEIFTTSDHQWFVSTYDDHYKLVKTSDLEADMGMRTFIQPGFGSDNYWTVVSIEETDREEMVWCVEEPITNSFTLTGGVHTHNCTFTVLRRLAALAEDFMLALLGAGTAIRVLPEDLVDMPKMYHTKIKHINTGSLYPKVKIEDTEIVMVDGAPVIYVGDSKKGWTDAYFALLLYIANESVPEVTINYNYIRAAGLPLKSSAGFASGPDVLEKAFEKIVKVSRAELDTTLAPIKDNTYRGIHYLDTFLASMEAVQCGGTRRTASIVLCSKHDHEIIECKNHIQDKPHLNHRYFSNNTIAFSEKPSYDELAELLAVNKQRGEPGILNLKASADSAEGIEGTNACSEIKLRSEQSCNLSEINAAALVKNGRFNLERACRAQRLSARIGYRQTEVVFGIDYGGAKWDVHQKLDRLTGCSITGIRDAMAMAPNEDWKFIFQTLRKVARDAVDEAAEEYGLSRTKLVTAIKPSGCWAKEYIRSLDDGLLFIDEITAESLETNPEGWLHAKEDYTFQGNLVSSIFAKEPSTIFEITLNNGRLLHISNEHPMSVNGAWVNAHSLAVGDKIDFELGNYKNEKHYKLNISPSDDKDITIPEYMSTDLAWLLGMLEDSVTMDGNLTILHRSLMAIERAHSIIHEIFNLDTDIEYNDMLSLYNVSICNDTVVSVLNQLLCPDENILEEFTTDRAPLAIRASSYKDIIAYLAGCGDTWGVWRLELYSMSKARHLQEVAEAVGISLTYTVNNPHGLYPVYLMLSEMNSNPSAINLLKGYASAEDFKAHYVENWSSIKSIKTVDNVRTYDIEVQTDHWYYQGGLKSHNTISTLPGVSPGAHFPIFKYAIKNMRVNNFNPLLKACKDAGYEIVPEPYQPETTSIVRIPCKALSDKDQDSVSAIEQLEFYKFLMENYVDHNVSVTVTVGKDEWEEVTKWIYYNWDSYIAVSFLPKTEGTDTPYMYMPMEKIDEDQYEKMLLGKYGYLKDNFLYKKFEKLFHKISGKRISEIIAYKYGLPRIKPTDMASIIYDFDAEDTGTDCASGACPVK